MSTANVTNTTIKRFPEVNIKEEFKGKLLISKNLLMKVHYIHQAAPRGIEWSGPLIYELLQGNISSPKDIIIKADNVILADIGTSGYTEYDMAADKPGMDTYFDALATGKKIGHLHTHHNMACFFSGTDTAELHENAPNHSYYLSLIVNYEDYTKWCAKIAIVGKIKREGTIKVQQELAGETSEFEETVLEDKEALYIIPLQIELDEEAKIYFDEINDILKTYKPYSAYTAGGYVNTYGKQGTIGFPATGTASAKSTAATAATATNATNAVVGKSLPLNKQSGGKMPEKTSRLYSGIVSFLDIPNNAFTVDKVKPLLAKWLSFDLDFKGVVGNALSSFSLQLKNEEEKKELLLAQLEDSFEDFVNICLADAIGKPGCTFGPAALHIIAFSCICALEPFKTNPVYTDIIDCLEPFILPEGRVNDATIERLSGISVDEKSVENTLTNAFFSEDDDDFYLKGWD